MSRIPSVTPSSTLAGLLAALGLLSGCAVPTSGPSATHSSSAAAVQASAAPYAARRDCQGLASAIAESRQELRAAQQREQDAWKVVIPFAVIKRHADARSDAAAAESHLAQLEAEARGQQCSEAAASVGLASFQVAQSGLGLRPVRPACAPSTASERDVATSAPAFGPGLSATTLSNASLGGSPLLVCQDYSSNLAACFAN